MTQYYSEYPRADPFNQDPGAVRAAAEYIEAFEPTWVLDPTTVFVEQPRNQEVLVANLSILLLSCSDGARLQDFLGGNMRAISALAEHDNYGSAVLHISAGVPPDELRASKIGVHELNASSLTSVEFIENADEQNMMLSGLLEVTGATVLRDDFADGNARGSRIYKGILSGQSVYLHEFIAPYDVECEGVTITRLRRSVWTESETAVRYSLGGLSARENQLFNSMGVELPAASDYTIHPETYIDRTRIGVIVRLYTSMLSAG